jgi:hypothetical protein
MGFVAWNIERYVCTQVGFGKNYYVKLKEQIVQNSTEFIEVFVDTSNVVVEYFETGLIYIQRV